MKKVLIIMGLFLYIFTLKSQTCGTCTLNITGYDTLAYTVSAGQTLCIDTTGNFAGSIILNGGSVCNKGMLNPISLTFNSGTIDNYSNANISSSLSLSANQLINNTVDAVMNIASSLTISGGTLSNNGIINVSQACTNTSGTLNNAGILNCLQMTGTNPVNNTGVINAN